MVGELVARCRGRVQLLERSGAAERLFADLIEQRSGEEVDRTIIECETERRKSQQVAEVVGYVLKIGRTAPGSVVAVLPGVRTGISH